jgi:uncharacterized protein YmfQ (DUF2313 family)
MSDRHVRRSGTDYTEAFLALLPQGQAWPRSQETTLYKTCRGLCAYWGFVDSRAADLLERESDPRITVELLPDWERNWGLPDPCYTAPQTYNERIKALMMRMTMLGAQSREFYTAVAAQLGYAITITEYRTFVVGIDRVGDARVYGAVGAPTPPMRNEWGNPIMNERGDAYVKQGDLSEWPYYGLGPESNRSYWTVHVSAKAMDWFRCGSGQCGVDPHLRIRLPDDLICLLDRWKPGHTEIIYDFTGITLTANSVPENAAIGTVVGTLGLDPAYMFTGTPVFTLTSNPGGKFSILGTSLKVAAALDYETATSHQITVSVSGIDPPSNPGQFIILVTDVELV